MRTASSRILLLSAALVLAACSDGSLRSPDLPPDQLIGIGNVVCTYPPGRTNIAVSQTATCQVVGACTYRRIDSEGNVNEVSGVCPDFTFNSSNPGVGTVDPGTGVVTGVSPGQTGITASGGGLTSNPTTVTVVDACAQSIVVTPATATIISGASAGTSQSYTATITLDNGSTVDVSTRQETAWASSDEDVATFTANVATAEPGLAEQTTVTVTATYSGPVCGAATQLTGSAQLTVRPAQLIATNAVCIDTIPPAQSFEGCRADSGTCTTEAIALEVGQTRDILVRARFDNGQECNVTGEAELSVAHDTVASLDDEATLTAVGEGETTLSAEFGGQVGERPVQVSAAPVNQVLGDNSLVVFAKNPFSNTEEISLAQARVYKFACVGADNVVIDGLGGEPVRAALKAYALAATCDDTALDSNGNCTAPDGQGNDTVAAFDNQLLTHQDEGVTDLPPRSSAPGADPLDDRIQWRSVAGYWNGSAGCATEDANASARVGDTHYPNAPSRELLLDDENQFPLEPATVQPNGLVHADGLLRVGFNCVTAEYENPEDPDNKITDGMTVLVLPVTNDVLLSGGNDGYELCDTLAPLFSGPLLGLVPTTELLSTVTATLTPLLEALDPVTEPVDGLLTTLLAELGGQLTGDLIAALDEALFDPVVEPLLCELTSGVNTLLRLLTGNPEPPQQCGSP